ncbi:MAG: site-2 protease family protein, partial [Armatimonadota bacterium]
MIETIGGWTSGIFAIAVVLGACIFIHELGHFAVAKFIGMKVEEFAMGFGRALWSRKRGETCYRINLVPLGGYVR